MDLTGRIGLILMACILGCLTVWIQNEQIESSYALRDKEAVIVQLQTEQRQLRSRLAYLDSPHQLVARLGNQELEAHPQQTRWLLRKQQENPTLLAFVREASHPFVRALALWVQQYPE